VRDSFARTMYDVGHKTKDVFIVVADISPAGSMAPFRKDFPDRFINGGTICQAAMRMSFGNNATSALLNNPIGVSPFDGSLYVADTNNHRIRFVNGGIKTVAGGGPIGDGGKATEAKLNRPSDLAFGADGTLYFADTYNSCVRAVKDGVITTVAGQCGKDGFGGDGGRFDSGRRPRGDAAPSEGEG